ncbi:MAG: hypothetical protein ABI960_05790 [Candidatus Eisenbacteria bacterium]
MMPPTGGPRPGMPPTTPRDPNDDPMAVAARAESEERARAMRAQLDREAKARRLRRISILLLLIAIAAAAVWYLMPHPGTKPSVAWERRIPPGVKITGPSIGVSPNGKWFALAWAEGSKVWYVRGTSEMNGSLRLDAPVAFSDTTRPFAAFDEDPPKAAVSNDGNLAIAWMTRPLDRAEGSVIAVARPDLEHDGRVALAQIEGESADGFLLCESVAYDDDGGLVATWIDGGPAQESKGEVGKLQCAVAGPQGAFESVTTLADGACSCCRTSMSWLGPERFAMTYRGVAEGNVRDIRFAVLHDEGEDGSGPSLTRDSHGVVRNDHWSIEGCPSEGPTVAAMGEKSAWVTWYTEGDPRGLYLARLEPRRGDGGLRWQTTETLVVDPRKEARHPAMATLSSGRPFVTFEGPTPEGGRALYARVFRGKALTPAERFTTANRAQRPVPARWGRNGVLIAWQEVDEQGPRIALAEWKGL